MNRIAVRLIVGVLLALLLVGLVDRFVIRPYRISERRAYAGQIFKGLVSLLRQSIDPLPPEQVQQALHDLALQLGHPVQMQPRNAWHLNQAEQRKLEDGDVVFRSKPSEPLIVLADCAEPGFLLVLGPVPSANTKQNFLDLISALVGVSAVSLLGFLIAAPLVRRLYRLEEVARSIAQGELHRRVEDPHNDELGLLAKRFNSMAESVEGLLKQQRQLLRAVSHELRTPIARLRFDLELIQDVTSPEARAMKILSMGEDLDELEALVDELLLFLRYRRGTPPKPAQALDSLELLDKLARKYGPLKPEIKLDLCPNEQKPAEGLFAEREGAERALGNILSNALRYAKRKVVVSFTLRDDNFLVIVDDDGVGIAPYQREAVLEPFTRVDGDRSRDSGSVGLGLAIANSILQAHHGRIEIQQSPLGGARFVCFWPLQQK